MKVKASTLEFLKSVKEQKDLEAAKVALKGFDKAQLLERKYFYSEIAPKLAIERFEEFMAWYENGGYLVDLGSKHVEERELGYSLRNFKNSVYEVDLVLEDMERREEEARRRSDPDWVPFFITPEDEDEFPF